MESTKNIENKENKENIENTEDKENIENIENKEETKVENTTTSTSTSIVFVMDSSGSMASMGNEPLQGLNSFYEKQKESGEFTSTLVFFSNEVKFHHQNLVGKDVPKITVADYRPEGMTALYDAIGSSIDLQKSQKTENVVFVILTDGHENASHKYTQKDIKNLIEEMEKEHKWVFIYLGANQDSFQVGNSIGIRHTADYEYSPAGCLNIMRSVSDTVSRCVSQDVRPENFSIDEIKGSSITADKADTPEITSIPNLTFPSTNFNTPILKRS